MPRGLAAVLTVLWVATRSRGSDLVFLYPTITFPRNITMGLGTFVNFRCELNVSEGSANEMFWLQGGARIPNDSRRHSRLEVPSEGRYISYLEVRDLRDVDAGRYTCDARARLNNLNLVRVIPDSVYLSVAVIASSFGMAGTRPVQLSVDAVYQTAARPVSAFFATAVTDVELRYSADDSTVTEMDSDNKSFTPVEWRRLKRKFHRTSTAESHATGMAQPPSQQLSAQLPQRLQPQNDKTPPAAAPRVTKVVRKDAGILSTSSDVEWPALSSKVVKPTRPRFYAVPADNMDKPESHQWYLKDKNAPWTGNASNRAWFASSAAAVTKSNKTVTIELKGPPDSKSRFLGARASLLFT
ncbi:hypothetical protein HPB49_006227 [Dermacentor silvarum]|uniref:Uncharacterized protein n=1 Tax=Dermacentor silvarum TaxID=543639 RepID=A0ACB8C7J1_DERSI|nr:hypothetical protein HPB49_006227 [Dermacentor silvarum]